ncbi:GTP cyclohydrolase I FolE [Rhodovibrio salinarum]|uniref:GTP cyclohydrolase 1 n=1 Tax=Rhodovibrio salinarum TaxID=1087 RepID=A0A934QKH8_9PROT|nr:GTP cyclohydrolase I FolE [Rhodovibrio salinarum]MBK1698387.1 GTP cyclohydrolase I FolE [Rhodovibrio salinarum]
MAPLEPHDALRTPQADVQDSGCQHPGASNGHHYAHGPGAQVDRAEAEAAVRTLLTYIGEDPDREGLVDTPKRVVSSYDEFFGGYAQDPEDILARTFEETDGYDEMIVLDGVEFTSHCEHHMVPIVGTAYIGYLPKTRVVGVSKLARVLQIYAKRLQIQERLTAQVANAIEDVLDPRGVAVVLRSQHQCMASRGVRQTGAMMTTSRMLGAFRESREVRQDFETLAGLNRR